MNQFEDIKDIWLRVTPPTAPAVDTIISKARNGRMKLYRKIFMQITCLVLAIIAMVVVLLKVKFNHPSSVIGIALMFIAVSGYIILRLRQAIFLRSINFSEVPAVLIGKFQELYKSQVWINTKGNLAYVLILNLAFGFYFYETLLLAPILLEWKIIFITAYLVWMLVATLIIGRNSTRKELAQTTRIIQNLERLKSGLQE